MDKSSRRKIGLLIGGMLIVLLFVMQSAIAGSAVSGLSAVTVAEQGDAQKTVSDKCVSSESSSTPAGSNIGETVATANGDVNERAKKMAHFFMDSNNGVDKKGLIFNRLMVAGILGNFQAESGIKPDRLQGFPPQVSQTKSNDEAAAWAKGGARGLGLAQWTGGRAQKLIALAKEMGKNWYDLDVQTEMIIRELAGAYRNTVYVPMTKASTVQQASDIWLQKYEVAASAYSDAQRSTRGNFARGINSLLETNNIGTNDNVGQMTVDGLLSDGQPADDSNTNLTSDNCQTVDGYDSDSSEAGDIPDALTGNYAWMCTKAGICKPGDFGDVWANTSHGYQCTWYAWTRLAMIHPGVHKDWSAIQVNGGDTANVIQQGKQPNWEADGTPHAGDGVSGKGNPFAGVGHIAVVERVKTDGKGAWTDIQISEGNHACAASCPPYHPMPDYGWNGWASRWLSKADVQKSGIKFFRNKNWANSTQNSDRNSGVAELAMTYVGKVPYKWGGTSEAGWDCSGFVQYVFAKRGVKLPRVSGDQAKVGVEIPSLAQAQKGDIIANAQHAAIYLGDGKVVNALNPKMGTMITDVGSAFKGAYHIRRL